MYHAPSSRKVEVEMGALVLIGTEDLLAVAPLSWPYSQVGSGRDVPVFRFAIALTYRGEGEETERQSEFF